MIALVEAISVIVRNETLDEKYPGGTVAYCPISPPGRLAPMVA